MSLKVQYITQFLIFFFFELSGTCGIKSGCMESPGAGVREERVSEIESDQKRMRRAEEREEGGRVRKMQGSKSLQKHISSSM